MMYAGLIKRAKSHFENCNNGPEETPVQGECSYILTPRATGAARPSPAGPECKKFAYLPIQVVVFFHNDKSNMGRVVQHFLFRIIDNDTYVIHTCPVKRVAILFIN